jgi:hypothetical protein
MNIALWIIAGLLALTFLASGAMKVIQRKEKLAASGFGFVEDVSAGTVKAIGGLEALAAVGLILPAVLDIAPVLVPLAAVGVVLLMVGAVMPWPSSWRGDASAPSPSPDDPRRVCPNPRATRIRNAPTCMREE